jgi:rhomboid protease GluP
MRNQPSSMHCPRCRRLISIDTDRCIHCGLRRPKIYASIPVLNQLIRGEFSFVDGIIFACFIMYVLSLGLDLGGISMGGGFMGFLAPSSQALYRLGMGGLVPLLQGRWWTVITANYLHGDILHILFNMLWLRQIGHLVEELFGASRFWIIYTLSGLLGSLLTILLGTTYFIGASGAIFGLFGALIFYGRSRGGVFGSNIFRQMLIWAGIGFFLSFVFPLVDIWGHVGGFIGGLAAAFLLNYQERIREQLWQHILAWLLLVGVAVCFIFMLLNMFAR